MAANLSHAADLAVAQDAHYFQGWTFNVSDSPRSCSTDVLSTESISGRFGSLAYTVKALDATTQAMSPTDTQWIDCKWPYFGSKIPVGNDPPASVDTVHFRSGNFLLKLSGPLPHGTVLFMQDFDGVEVFDIEFRSCAGSAVDASSFDFLRVSDPALPGPSITIPAHTPGRAWSVASAMYSSNNETTGIVVRRSDVCQIALRNTKSKVIPIGGRHFFLGVAPKAVFVAPASVPTLQFTALLGLSGLLGALGFRRMCCRKN